MRIDIVKKRFECRGAEVGMRHKTQYYNEEGLVAQVVRALH
jgi:hypothetical protein